MRTGPSETGGVIVSPDGVKYDLRAVVSVPLGNPEGDMIVVCRGIPQKKPGSDGYVPCNLANIQAAFADVIKQLGGVEGLDMKVMGPFEIPLGSKSVPADPCCQATAEKAPEQNTAKPKRPSRPRKAAAKKPARRRR